MKCSILILLVIVCFINNAHCEQKSVMARFINFCKEKLKYIANIFTGNKEDKKVQLIFNELDTYRLNFQDYLHNLNKQPFHITLQESCLEMYSEASKILVGKDYTYLQNEFSHLGALREEYKTKSGQDAIDVINKMQSRYNNINWGIKHLNKFKKEEIRAESINYCHLVFDYQNRLNKVQLKQGLIVTELDQKTSLVKALNNEDQQSLDVSYVENKLKENKKTESATPTNCKIHRSNAAAHLNIKNLNDCLEQVSLDYFDVAKEAYETSSELLQTLKKYTISDCKSQPLIKAESCIKKVQTDLRNFNEKIISITCMQKNLLIIVQEYENCRNKFKSL